MDQCDVTTNQGSWQLPEVKRGTEQIVPISLVGSMILLLLGFDFWPLEL